MRSSGIYEQQRPVKLLEMCKDYDIVFDFHNTFCPDNDCTFVGEGANEELLAASWLLGLPRVIVADYDCINKYALNCVSIEISVQSRLNDVKVWRQKLQMKGHGGAPSANRSPARFPRRLQRADEPCRAEKDLLSHL